MSGVRPSIRLSTFLFFLSPPSLGGRDGAKTRLGQGEKTCSGRFLFCAAFAFPTSVTGAAMTLCLSPPSQNDGSWAIFALIHSLTYFLSPSSRVSSFLSCLSVCRLSSFLSSLHSLTLTDSCTHVLAFQLSFLPSPSPSLLITKLTHSLPYFVRPPFLPFVFHVFPTQVVVE